MSETVVIDASLAAMWAVPEPYSEQALTRADQMAEAGTRLIAPCLLVAEVTNALYKRILRGERWIWAPHRPLLGSFWDLIWSCGKNRGFRPG